ncbi:MAG: hypothetical protein K8S55_09595 [Phycisphaerae bacterium]|nr:hypothetical protein [Phycisphaerae bacterium]
MTEMDRQSEAQLSQDSSETAPAAPFGPKLLGPTVLLTLPGGPAVGFLLAWRFGELHPSRLGVGLGAAVLVIALGMWLYRRFSRRTVIGPLCLAAGISLGVLAGGVAGGWADTLNLNLFLAAAAVGAYVFVVWLIAAPPADPPRRMTWLAWGPALVTVPALLCMAIMAILRSGLTEINTVICLYLLLWVSTRTIYFCRALRGWPSRARVAQAVRLLARGLMLLQASLIAGLDIGDDKLGGVIAIVVTFVLFWLPTMLEKLFPETTY